MQINIPLDLQGFFQFMEQLTNIDWTKHYKEYMTKLTQHPGTPGCICDKCLDKLMEGKGFI